MSDNEMTFTRPDSYVVSVRLNVEESKALTAEAKRSGEKLSSFIKAAALETVERRRAVREQKLSVGTGEQRTTVLMTIGLAAGGAGAQGGPTADGVHVSSSWTVLGQVA